MNRVPNAASSLSTPPFTCPVWHERVAIRCPPPADGGANCLPQSVTPLTTRPAAHDRPQTQLAWAVDDSAPRSRALTRYCLLILNDGPVVLSSYDEDVTICSGDAHFLAAIIAPVALSVQSPASPLSRRPLCLVPSRRPLCRACPRHPSSSPFPARPPQPLRTSGSTLSSAHSARCLPLATLPPLSIPSSAAIRSPTPTCPLRPRPHAPALLSSWARLVLGLRGWQ